MLKRISKRQAGDAADDSRGDFCFTHYGVFQQCGVSMMTSQCPAGTPNASKQSSNNANTNIGSGIVPNCITPTRDDDGTDTNNHHYGDDAFSIVDWIQHNLPCVGNATHLVNVSHDEELDNNNTAATVAADQGGSPMIQQQQTTSSFIDPSNSWCDLSTITPCPPYAAAATSNPSEKDNNNNAGVDHAAASSQSPVIIMESSTNNRTAVIGNHHGNNGTNHFSGGSSWLSGH
eukprot:scaffold41146_cov25-Cyclotella_meneghiniana.AAC.1